MADSETRSNAYVGTGITLVLDGAGTIGGVTTQDKGSPGPELAGLVGQHVDDVLGGTDGAWGGVFERMAESPRSFIARFAATDSAVRVRPEALATAAGRQWLCRVESITGAHGADASLLEQVVEHSPIAKVLADATGVIRYVNPQAERLFGYTRGELVGLGVDVLVPAEARERHPELRGRYQGMPSPRALSGLRAQRKDGSLVPVQLGLTPIEIDGQTRVLVSAIDETDRIRAEQSLLAVIEHTPAAVFELDGDGRVKVINAHARRLFGYSSDEAVGRHLDEFVCGDAGAPATGGGDQASAFVLGLPRGESTECHGVYRDGRRFPVDVVHEVLDTPNGRVFLAAVTDLTPILESGRMLERARAMAEEVADAKAGFLATISHEMRTPLNSIIGVSELLDDSALAPEQREYVERIRTGGTMLLNLIQDVLDLAKLDSGSLALQSVPFDPRQCVRGALDIVRGAAERKGLPLNCEIAEDLPAHLVGDADRLRQILVNLVSNAVKFTETGAVSVSVFGQDVKPGCLNLHVEVCDTGIGIHEHRLEQLFHAFSQVDPDIQRRYGGTGLGLVICKSLIEAMGGSIMVDSVAGLGSTFSFHVPLRIADATLLEQAASEAVRKKPLTPMRVLLVEDNPINQRVAQMMLARLDQEVAIATNGHEAVDAVRQGEFDVILMDLLMPEMDGLEATRRIRAELGARPQPRIVAMTANAMPGDRERCLEAGMDDYLSKPVRVHALAELLRRYQPAPRRELAMAEPPPEG